MYFFGLKHYDGHIPYFTSRVRRTKRAHCFLLSQIGQRGKHHGKADSNPCKDIVPVTLGSYRQLDGCNEIRFD